MPPPDGHVSLWYGYEPEVDIPMGPNSWYKVFGDGKGGVKCRAEADTTSASAGEIARHCMVRVDAVRQMPNGKVRCRVVEVKGPNKTEDVPAQPPVWSSMKMLDCESKACGHCHNCDDAKLPSENAAERDALAAAAAAALEQMKAEHDAEMATQAEKMQSEIDEAKASSEVLMDL
jgi:hypothetical protein